MINRAPFCSNQFLSPCVTVVLIMTTWNRSMAENQAGRQPVGFRPSSLCMVSEHELRGLRAALAHGALPTDLETKLIRLSEGDLIQRFVEQNCRVFIAMLLAAWEGSFKGVSAADCDRLLRVLAYVRKDDDAIADYKPGGFVDDQQEVRAAAQQLQPLLTTFKAWRLRHQVPGMWLHN
jgi:hypothetical protein